MSEINIFIKIILFIRGFFVKSKNIVYINSNKRQVDFNKIREYRKSKWIINQSKINKIGYSSNKYHLCKMKIQLYFITNYLSNIHNFIYSGFVSVPFAIFDGYSLGDNRSYLIIDFIKDNNKISELEYKKKRKNDLKNTFDLTGCKYVNLLIESSGKINRDKCKDYKCFSYDEKANIIISEYLENVYNFVYDFFECCNENKIELVNIYANCRQSVSFVIGTAIQKHDPKVVIYEYDDGKYTWGLDLKTAKIIKSEVY